VNGGTVPGTSAGRGLAHRPDSADLAICDRAAGSDEWKGIGGPGEIEGQEAEMG
jgi:hypothetical protein